MLKTLGFFFKIAVFVGVLVWLAEQDGQVRIEWMDYVITIHFGLFLAGLLCLISIAIFTYRVVKTFIDFPSSYRYFSQRRAKDMGYHALTLGLTAVAAGDAKVARQQADKVRSLLPDDDGLPLLLKAQAARLEGREEDAQDCFAILLENKDTAFLGVRGLLQASLDAGDTGKALDLARHAQALHPKQPWILRNLYDLEVSERAWSSAEKTLKEAVKAGAIAKERAVNDRVAMALAIALSAEQEGLQDVAVDQYRKARRLDRDSIPAVLLLVEYYMRQDQYKKARALIEKVWKKSPHAAFVDVWKRLKPEKYKGKGTKKEEVSHEQEADSLSELRWLERLIAINPDSARLQLAAGLAALSASLWGEARHYFEEAERLRPSRALYKALAALEERVGRVEAAHHWLEMAADADGDRVWVCAQTGRIYPTWSPIAEPHGSFNSIVWDFPHYGSDQMLELERDVSRDTAALIEVDVA